jgi:hypothetical protein
MGLSYLIAADLLIIAESEPTVDCQPRRPNRALGEVRRRTCAIINA